MVQQISGITSATSKKVIVSGFNSMMKEFENLILMTFNWNVSEGNIGEDKAKMLICWCMRDKKKSNVTLSFKD